MKHQKSSKKSSTVYSIVFQPFIQVTYQNTLMICHEFVQEITYMPMRVLSGPCQSDSIQSEETQTSGGLDCSGQGQCQPNADSFETNQMQSFLVNANRRSSSRVLRQKKSQTSAKSKEKNNSVRIK